MKIYIIRHTRVNLSTDICYGQTDVSLAETFLDELAVYQAKLAHELQQIKRVYSSPLTRCMTLAHHLTDLPIISSAKLMEINFGDWENKAWNDLNQIELHAWMNDFVTVHPPNGESLEDLFQRVSLFLEELRASPLNLNSNESKSMLIVAHAGVIRCIVAFILNMPLQSLFKIRVGYGDVFCIELNQNPVLDQLLYLH